MGIAASKVDFNYKNGLNPSYIPYKNTVINPKIGLYARFLDFTYLDFEAQFSFLQKGGENESEITTINQPEGTGEILISETQFDYLQFQLGIRPKRSTQNYVLYSFLFSSFDYLLRVKNIPAPKERFENIVLGYSAGIGIRFLKVFNNSLFFETGYSADISEIYKSENLTIKSRIWQVRVGVSIFNNN